MSAGLCDYSLLLECEETCANFPFFKIKWTKAVIQKGFHSLVKMMLNSGEAVTFICICLHVNTVEYEKHIQLVLLSK